MGTSDSTQPSARRRAWTRRFAGAALLCALAAVSGCSGDGFNPFTAFANLNSSASVQAYSLAATVSGLTSSGLVLMVNAEAVSVPAGSTTQALAASLLSGASYSVTVQTDPTGETCAVTGGTGTIQTSNVTNVLVSCTDQSYVVGGTISGLVSGGLVLANGGDSLVVTLGASTFTMPTAVAYASTYGVTVQTQPTGLTCSVSNGAGTMDSAAVSNVAVSCAANTYTVGGSINGLVSAGLVLLDNGGNALMPSANATQFTMPTAIAYGSPYAITVQTAPPGMVCSVSNGSGTMGPADVTAVSVGCMPNFTLLYSFAGGTADGVNPYHSLIQASDGNFYGTTETGGAHNGGIIFEVSPSGSESLFYSFAAAAYSGLMQASDGNFYGTTASGGTSGRGTVFEITPSGTESVLFSFPAGSSDPYTGVIEGRDGNFYGTTGAGGASDEGIVFELTPSGTQTILHTFPKTGSDGQEPYAGLVEGSDGNFYGTTYFGGSDGFGTVFKVTPGGAETVLYSFAGGTDAANPYSGLIQASDGNFYGTTYNGGAHGLGTVYEITAGGTETVLYSFAGGTSDGANPQAGVVQGSDGNFYGSTYLGGPDGVGTVFELTPSGMEFILHSFAGGTADGANPSPNLVQASDGTLYGSTFAGGVSGHGTFFKVALQ
ncbi:MAG TPA: choice-of-anchor tandem repeat GloVer-containing protein [Steroidobacteraceae bacterium]|jgi:uncharacterized repeat protein (TIGR03803 family)|nr:choice-of-anchor tandem repeat GloVer-containing protein [Steroidobacteraceae bacterium]